MKPGIQATGFPATGSKGMIVPWAAHHVRGAESISYEICGATDRMHDWPL